MKLLSTITQIYQRFCNFIGDFPNLSAILQLISAISQIYRLTDKKRQISAPCNFPLLFCCFIYLSTFIFYIVEYLKKGKGKTYEKKVMMSLMLMTFLSAVEGTIVSTAIPRITSDLSGVELVSWVYAIYMLATAVSTPIYGKLADLFGRKKFYLLELQSF